MANEDIGEITCPCCGMRGKVRKASKGKRLLYWVCGCGIMQPRTQRGQDFILSNATIYGAQDQDKDDPVYVEDTATEPESPVYVEPAPKRRGGLLDWL